jgi:dihydroorotase
MLTSAPARVLNIPFYGIRENAPADLCIFAPDEVLNVNKEELHSKSKNSVFKDMSFFGKIKYTVCRGEIVFGG